QRLLPQSSGERRIVMTIAIDKVRTGQQIRLLMEKRGVTVRDVKNALSLACVQSVYHWLDGQSMPTLDNLYALSDLLEVPMDMLVCGNRRYDPNKNIPEGAERLFRYYRLIQECMAA
ncbi:MAG: helix-turn-helix transcriptional regulator, partial [Lachnospiraceae bacterium]|nr:helix-turn-helix transcriptional regulator [Lachnospiraceae bacterium]